MNYFLKSLIKGQLMTTNKFEELLNSLPDQAKRYHEVEQSAKLREYQELEQLVGSDAFQTTKREMSKKDFEKSEEAQKEKRLAELRKDQDLIFFLNANKEVIQDIDRSQEIYRDDFNWTSLSASDWKSGFAYPSNEFKATHSFVEENQAYNNGKNVETKDSILYIHTKKEAVQAPSWDPKKGMIMQDFEYTSDVINNAEKLELQEGCSIQVKVRCRGFLDHGIYMRSKKHLPLVSMFEYNGLKVYCGQKTTQESKMHLIEDMQPLPYVIYTLVWENGMLTWFVNNVQIHEEKSLIPADEKLYLHLFSFVRKSSKRYGSGTLQVDWIRVHKLNK